MDRRTAVLYFASLALCGCDINGKDKVYSPSLGGFGTTIFRFGVHPYLTPIDMYKVYQPLMEYLDIHINGVKFMLESSKDYADYEQKLYSRSFEFALPNPYQTLHSLKRGYDVIAKMAPDSDFRGIIVARKDKNIKNISQLKGHGVSFPAPTALAATMMPLMYLHEHGLDVKRDIKMHFVGSQHSSILSAHSGNTYAGATWPPPWRSWCKSNPEKASEMEIIAETHSLINNSVVVRDDVSSQIASSVQKALIELSRSAQGLKILENMNIAGFNLSNKKEYDVVDLFMNKFEKIIGLPQTLGKQI